MKEKIITISFVIYIFIFSISSIIITDDLVSESERRTLSLFPSFSIDNIMDKSFMEKLDSYFLDHFVYRDEFRSIKANVNYNVLNMLINNNVYLLDNYIFKSEFPTDYKSIDNFNNIINSLIEQIPGNKYISIIPDKNYFIDGLFLNIDYDYIFDNVSNINAEYIDILNDLNLDNYYMTDTHWKQETLKPVINTLSQYLSFDYEFLYDDNIIKDFNGVYYGQSSLDLEKDTIVYLTNDKIINSDVYYLEGDETSVYTLKDSMDKYDVYLNGATSYIEIINESADNDKELVIFRDSFGSSITPLLISSYHKITVIDIRYIKSDYYLDKINNENQDVLFLYSTLILNNSYSLKN